MAKRRRSAAQKAATARMLAARRAKYSHNPSPRKRRHSRRKMHHNPSARHHVKRAYHRIRHHARRYRRNPSPRLGGLGNMLMPAVYGAGGALAIDLVTGYLPLPLAIKVSPARHLIKGLLAVGMGMVFRGRIGSEMAKGGLTVALHDAAREAVQTFAPSVQLGAEPTVQDLAGIGYYSPAATGEPALGFYQDQGMAGMAGYSTEYNEYTA